MRPAVLATALVLCTVSARAQAFPLSIRDTVLTVPAGSTAVRLADSMLAAGSDSVALDGRPLVRNRDYLFDYAAGGLTLRNASAVPAVLTVRYRRIPLFSRRRYAHRKLAPPSPGDTAAAPVPVVRPRETDASDEGSDLVLYGSKTFGISMGSGDAFAVEQALNLNIRGTVARDVRVTASLSDQNTPIPPEGDTRTLRELDGVKIKAEGKGVTVEMGNLEVAYDGTEFGDYERRLEGARAAVDRGTFGFSACGALSEGQFTSVALSGGDGRQGPYFLPGPGGETGYNVLPGTERIWLDGEAMVRGRENDYVIDYGDGSVTFTNRRLITGESRITADYEYYQNEYRRNFYNGGGYLKLFGGRVRLTGTVLYQGDDGENPLEDGALDDTARMVLEAAGDAPQAAADSWRSIVRDSTGRYVWRGDTLAAVEAGAGSLAVVFSYAGEGNGSYEYVSGTGTYRYVGEGEGDYVPQRLFALPQSRLLTDLRMELQPFRALVVTGELAVTEEDKNTMSARDDDDNLGSAMLLRLAYAPDSLRVRGRYAGALRLDGAYRRTGARFASVGRVTGVEEYERQWNVTPAAGRTAGMLDGTAEYRYRDVLAAGGELGQLEQFGLSGHLRRKAYLRTAFKGLPDVKAEWRDASADGDAGTYWERHAADASWALGVLTPEAGFEREYCSGAVERTFDNTTARTYLITGYSGGVSTRGGGGGVLAGAARYEERTGEKEHAPGFRARTVKLEGALRDWKTVSGQLAVTRRDKERSTDAGAEDARTILVNTRAEAAPLRRAVAADLRYDVTGTRNARKKEVFRKVDAYGEYSFETDPYTGDTLWSADPDGEYVREYVAIGEYRPSVEVKGSASLGLMPRRWLHAEQGRGTAALKALSANTYFVFERVSLADRFGTDVFLPGGGALDTSRTLRRERTLRQDVNLEPAAAFSLRLRYRQSRTDNWEDYADGFTRLDEERSVRLRLGRQTRLSNETEFSVRNEREEQGAERSDIDARNVESTFYRKLSAVTDLSAGLQYRRDLERESGIESGMYAVRPALRRAFGRSGRLSLDLEAVNVTDSTASYRQLAGNRKGWSYRLNLLFDYRVNAYVTYYVTYAYMDEPYLDDRRQITHQGRAEVRASF